MDTIKVQRANIELDINPEDREYYIKQGYSVVDDYGNVIEAAVPNDANTLKIMVAQLQKENEMLKAQLEAAKVTTVEKVEKPKTTTRKSTK